MAESTSPKTQSLTPPPTALGIDSNFDPATKGGFEYREKHVYPYLISKGFTIQKCQGVAAKRFYAAAEAQKTGVLYITGVGHGSSDAFTGNYFDCIFEVGRYSADEVKGKIIHLLSCKTAKELGPDFVKNGCLAFFGYDEDFVYTQASQEAFFECDSEIDRAFADGLTAEQVYERVIKVFSKWIAELNLQGHLFESAILQQNLDSLCCPSSPKSPSSFGDPQAKLTLS